MRFSFSSVPLNPSDVPRFAHAGRMSVLSLLCLCLSWGGPAYAQETPSAQPVSALGRLEPENGITTLAAPSTPEAILGGIMTELHVKRGDRVSKGQLLATTDTAPVMEAIVSEAKAKLQLAISRKWRMNWVICCS